MFAPPRPTSPVYQGPELVYISMFLLDIFSLLHCRYSSPVTLLAMSLAMAFGADYQSKTLLILYNNMFVK